MSAAQPPSSSSEAKDQKPRVVVKKWNAVAVWKYASDNDNCAVSCFPDVMQRTGI